jgi:hypothetical protein
LARDTISIQVASLNDPPRNTVPTARTVDEDTTLVFATGLGNAISIADVDAGSGDVRTVLTVGNGTLRLVNTAGLAVQGNGTIRVTMTGTVTAVNWPVSLTYTPALIFMARTL